MSSAHMSGRGGPTNRLAGLLEGRAHLSGTTETLVGEDPVVPMSLTMSWQIVFATFRDLAFADLAIMLTCGTQLNFMMTWNTRCC
jgi:hypothetical protein